MDVLTQNSLYVAVFIAAALPGPCAVLTVGRAARHGRLSGIAVSAGVVLASALLAMFALTAMLGVLTISETVFRAMRWAGIIVLLYLAFRMIVPVTLTTDRAPRRPAATGDFCAGALTLLSSPSALAFLLALLPQFIRTPASGLGPAIAAAIFFVAGVATTQTCAVLAGSLKLSRGGSRWIEYAGAALLIGFAGGALVAPPG
jgi:threonine/homoserine/homoserine lactone efflux protein